MVPQWQTAGKWGPPSNESILVDQYVKWNFHLFVAVDFKLPVMFSSPYGGTATYGNWTIKDENGKGGPDDFNPDWRENPNFCLNVVDGGQDTCKAFGIAPAKVGALVEGFVSGALADQPNLANCVMKNKDAVTELKELFSHPPTDPVQALEVAAQAGWSLHSGMKGCLAAPDDLSELKAWGEVLKRLPHPQQFIGNVTQNVHDNAKNIQAEFAFGIASYMAEQWMDAGLQMGMALRRAAVGIPPQKPIGFYDAVGTYCGGIFAQGNVKQFHVTANLTLNKDSTLDYHYHEDIFGHRVRMDCTGESVFYHEDTGKLGVEPLFANKSNCMWIAVTQDPSHLAEVGNHVHFDGEHFYWQNGWGTQKYTRIADGQSCPYPPQPMLV